MTNSLYSDDQKRVVRKLLQARKESNLSQLNAAKMLGKTQSYISKVESGQRLIDVVELKQFARIYKKEINYFL